MKKSTKKTVINASLFVLTLVIDVYLGAFLWNNLITKIFLSAPKLDMFQTAALMLIANYFTSDFKLAKATTDPYTATFTHMLLSGGMALVGWVLMFFI